MRDSNLTERFTIAIQKISNYNFDDKRTEKDNWLLDNLESIIGDSFLETIIDFPEDFKITINEMLGNYVSDYDGVDYGPVFGDSEITTIIEIIDHWTNDTWEAL